MDRQIISGASSVAAVAGGLGHQKVVESTAERREHPEEAAARNKRQKAEISDPQGHTATETIAATTGKQRCGSRNNRREGQLPTSNAVQNSFAAPEMPDCCCCCSCVLRSSCDAQATPAACLTDLNNKYKDTAKCYAVAAAVAASVAAAVPPIPVAAVGTSADSCAVRKKGEREAKNKNKDIPECAAKSCSSLGCSTTACCLLLLQLFLQPLQQLAVSSEVFYRQRGEPHGGLQQQKEYL